MKLTGTFADLSLSIAGGARLTLNINEKRDLMDGIDDLREIPLSVEIKPYKRKRSLDANAYAWVLLDKLAARCRLPKSEIYRAYIREIGGNSETVCVKDEAVEKLCAAWCEKGLGWQADVTPSKLKGCHNVILYYGSSTYDTAQMTRLIELIVQDCKEQGIQTETPDEIERMIALCDR